MKELFEELRFSKYESLDRERLGGIEFFVSFSVSIFDFR